MSKSRTEPLELLDARRQAHEAFDPIWKELMARGKPVKLAKAIAYLWLQREMKLSAVQCHMTVMGVEQCQKVVAICNSRRGR